MSINNDSLAQECAYCDANRYATLTYPEHTYEQKVYDRSLKQVVSTLETIAPEEAVDVCYDCLGPLLNDYTEPRPSSLFLYYDMSERLPAGVTHPILQENGT